MKHSIILLLFNFALFAQAMEVETLTDQASEKKELSLVNKMLYLKAGEANKIIELICRSKIPAQGVENVLIALQYKNLKIKSLRKYIETSYEIASCQPLCQSQINYRNKCNITILDLENNELSNLPLELQQLRIKKLELSNNKFQNLIPAVVGYWSGSLEIFWINNNNIKEFDPIGDVKLSDFAQLHGLDLRGNPIKKKLPEEEIIKLHDKLKQQNKKLQLGLSGFFEVSSELLKIQKCVVGGNFIAKEPEESVEIKKEVTVEEKAKEEILALVENTQKSSQEKSEELTSQAEVKTKKKSFWNVSKILKKGKK